MKTVIIIDDDAEILDIFKLIFERAGYFVTIFNSGEAILKNEFEEPDIFVIDKQLIGADGLDVCRYLKNRGHHYNTPVIIFSASPYIDKQAADAGADDFLEKPFKSRTLLQMVERHLN